MATVSITINDAVVNRVLDAIAAKTGWDPLSGITKANWAKQQAAQWIKNMVVAYEADQAGKNAYDSQLTTSQSQIDVS